MLKKNFVTKAYVKFFFFCSFTEFNGCEKLLLNLHAEKRTVTWHSTEVTDTLLKKPI